MGALTEEDERLLARVALRSDATAHALTALVRRLAGRVEELEHYAAELTGLVVIGSSRAKQYAFKRRDEVFRAPAAPREAVGAKYGDLDPLGKEIRHHERASRPTSEESK